MLQLQLRTCRTFGSVPEVEPKALLAVSQEIEQAASR